MTVKTVVREIRFSVGETSDLGLPDISMDCPSCKGLMTPEYSVWDMDAHVSVTVGACDDCGKSHGFLMHDEWVMTNDPQMFADFALNALDAPYRVLRKWVITDL